MATRDPIPGYDFPDTNGNYPLRDMQHPPMSSNTDPTTFETALFEIWNGDFTTYDEQSTETFFRCLADTKALHRQAIAEAVEAARLTARDFVIAAPTSQDPRNQRLYESPDNPIGGFPAVMDGPIRENGNQPPTVISTYALRDAILWWLETKFDERFDTRLDRLSNPQPLKENQ